MVSQIVLILFDHTRNMVQPWAKAGFVCYCVDLKHSKGESREDNIIRVGADIREWLPPYAAVKILSALPSAKPPVPCSALPHSTTFSRAEHSHSAGVRFRSPRCGERQTECLKPSGQPGTFQSPASTI